MNERKINYSDLVLRPGDSAETINEKLITEQLENIFSYDQAVEILSEFEKNGIQAGMAKQLEVLLANKEEYETAIVENQDKKRIIVENDNPNPKNIRGYDGAVAQSREELRKINEQIAVLEKGLEEMNNTQNPETNLPATEEKAPEEPQNTTDSVTPTPEEHRVVEATPVENNPVTTQDTTDSNDWKNNPNDYRTILGEIEKSENELRHLNSERDTLIAAQRSMPEASYQREMSTIERFLAREQLKLDQNRNLANNYEAAYSPLKDLDGLTGQPDNSRDAQDRREREEEITAKRKELASHMDELTDTLATEVRNRVLSERANRNNNVAGLTPEQIISRYGPFAEIYDNNGIKETDPQVLVAEAERQIREREAAKEETTPEPVIAAAPTKRNANLELTPDEVIRRYGPAARTYDQAGITGTRAQRLVAAARDSLENQNNNNNGIKETDPQALVAEAERQIREKGQNQEPPKVKKIPPLSGKTNTPPAQQDPEVRTQDTDQTGSQTPENNEPKVKKGLYTIMEELTNGLELTRKMNGKYTASNIRVVKGFKEELKSGNVLYNIAHFATAVVAIPINFVRKVVDKLTYSIKERENIEKFKERLSKLSQEDLETIWNEYRGTRVIQERYVVIINTLINERMQQYALEKVSAIRKDMSRKYKILFDSMKMVESCDKLLQTETDLQRRAAIKQERDKALAGKAEMISSLRSQYIEANQILSGGAHGVSEDMKAAKTKLSIVGKRFAKDHDFNNELAAKQAEIEKRENAAIAKGDNEAALRAFIDGETLLRGETEIKNTIYGQRSVGEKYSMPLPQGLDYSDDPFVRDLLRTVAYVGMGISVANSLITHGPKSDALLQQNKADTDRVNAANDATIEQVHQAGDTLTGNRDDFITGMQSQTGEKSVNISQSLERETLDSNSWYLGTEYNKMDAFNHARYNAMSDAAKAKLEDIATKCYNNQITDMQALEMIKEVANTQHQNLIDIYTEYQPILEQYASTHPFDLHGVQESMQFVLDHPDAVIKMNEGMVESIQVGEELAGLSAEHIAAINSLPSDLATTLFGVATSTAALTYQAASTMNNNVKSGKYGNETTDMIQDYIDSKAKANEAAPEEKSSGSRKSR